MGMMRVAAACMGQLTFGHFEQACQVLIDLRREIEEKRDEIPLRMVTGSIFDVKDDAQDAIDALTKAIECLDEAETLAIETMAWIPD